MRKLVIVTALIASICAYADEDVEAQPAKEEIQARIEAAHRKFGGFVEQPGSRRGSIGFLNAQDKIPLSEMESVVKNMKQMLKYDMPVKDIEKLTGLPSKELMKNAGVSVAIIAVDDPALPVLLAAPEDRWALVNVAKLSEGIKDNAIGVVMLKNRFRGELQRAFALVCGGWASQHRGNLSVARTFKDIDALNPDALMGDLAPRYENYLNAIGISAPRIVMYLKACQEGWAPAPTNDAQKAIWDKTHTTPTAPIKIKYEKK